MFCLGRGQADLPAVFRSCYCLLHVHERREGAAVEEALLDVPLDFRREHGALLEAASESDGGRMAAHCLHPFVGVAASHTL